jgi:hypothetical protein
MSQRENNPFADFVAIAIKEYNATFDNMSNGHRNRWILNYLIPHISVYRDDPHRYVHKSKYEFIWLYLSRALDIKPAELIIDALQAEDYELQNWLDNYGQYKVEADIYLATTLIKNNVPNSNELYKRAKEFKIAGQMGKTNYCVFVSILRSICDRTVSPYEIYNIIDKYREMDADIIETYDDYIYPSIMKPYPYVHKPYVHKPYVP